MYLYLNLDQTATSCLLTNQLVDRPMTKGEMLVKFIQISEAVFEKCTTVSKKMFLFYILNWLNGAFNHLPR